METLNLDKKCPSCGKQNSIVIEKNNLICKEKECDFNASYCCPICDKNLSDQNFDSNEKGEFYICDSCKSKIYTKKIKYLLENQLIVDHENKCPFCTGPTIHRENMNLSNRCFFFPQCSGQANLFGSKKESLVFLDFETTGLEIGRDFIIEIGAIKIDEDGYEHTFESLIKPPVELSEQITKITGISNDMLINAPQLKDNIIKLVNFIDKATIIAHNAEFDLLWLLTSLLRLNIPVPNNQVICTLDWAKKQSEPRCSLSALTKKYAISHSSAHRALADAVATKELFFIFENSRTISRPINNINIYLETSQKIADKYKKYTQL
jgi:DNA polymerase III subunit epsilon